MLRHARAALAAVAVAAFTLAPAVAGERATLKVTARVVDRCTVEVPSRVPPWVWRDRSDEPWRFVRHRCHGKPPFWVDARRVLLAYRRDRIREGSGDDGRRVHEMRHPTRDDVVLITISY
jgi:hypothetical protein